MTRDALEKYQVILYLVAISCGLLVGTHIPYHVPILEVLLWPLLGLLLYTTFTQVPLAHLRAAFTDRRFMVAAVVGNFLVLPVVVWALLAVSPADPVVRLGILLVLLVPCTDWFITFTHLGGGDTRHAIVFSPISLLLQLVLLPVYLWLFLGAEVTVGVAQWEMFIAFLGLIVLPLVAAAVTERWADFNPGGQRLLRGLGTCPVPLLALVVFSIAAAQVGVVLDSIELLGHLLLIFNAFLVLAGGLAKALAIGFGLPTSQGRVLAFSMGTRNSFVVLPLALALPASYELAVVVVVFQSLVELIGMAVYLWWVPQKLFREAS